MRMVLSIGSCVGLSAGLLLPVPATADPMDLETAAAVRVDGPFDGAQFGSAISGAGDFDGDGYADLLVGAATADVDNRTDSGAAYIVFGGPGLTSGRAGSSRDIRIAGPAAMTYTGSRVAGVGDVNDDGLDDVLIASTGYDPAGRLNAGAVYLVLGTRQPADVDLGAAQDGWHRLEGASEGDRVGSEVAAAGDVNADGHPDMLLTTTNASPSQYPYAGITYVVYGGPQDNRDLAMLGIHGARFSGAAAYDNSGEAVTRLGDVNGDKISDFAIGAPGSDASGVNQSGSTYVVFGSPGSKAEPSICWVSAAIGSTAWTCRRRAGMPWRPGDMNGDGLADVVIGSEMFTAGRAYVVHGSGTGGTVALKALGTRGYRVEGANYTYAAQALAGVGDVDFDGYADVLVGAPATGSRNGTTYLLRGRPSSADTTITSIPDRYDGPPTASSSGWALTGLGDVNGDGAGDFAIGAPAASKGGTNTGSVYVIYGKPAPTPPKVTPSPAPDTAASLTVTARKARKKLPHKGRVVVVRNVVVSAGQKALIRVRAKPRARIRVKKTSTTVAVRMKHARRGKVTVRITASGAGFTPVKWVRKWQVRRGPERRSPHSVQRSGL